MMIMLLVTNICAQESVKKNDKYADYIFLPEYGQEDTDWAKEIIADSLKPWREPYFRYASNAGNDVVVAYKADLSRAGVPLFKEHSYKLMAKGIKPNPSGWESVGVVKRGGTILEILRAERSNLLWPRGGVGSGDVCGCIDIKPLFKAELFKEREKALFVVTGTGDFTNMFAGNSYSLTAFSGGDYQKLLEVLILAVDYLPPNIDKHYEDFYYPATGYSLGKLKIINGEGRKRFGKVFVQDFNKDNKLDILVWHREYKSRRISPTTKSGFDLDKNEFTWYEENETSNGFNKKEISIEQAETWLTEKKLTWKQGWPNKSLCTGSLKNLPITTIEDDPVVEQ